MWVAENYTYGSRKIRFDLSLRDRVIVLVRYGWRRAGRYPEGIYRRGADADQCGGWAGRGLVDVSTQVTFYS
jgi:hypothetical protein